MDDSLQSDAGRVHRSLDPIPDMETLAGKVCLYSNIDPIFVES